MSKNLKLSQNLRAKEVAKYLGISLSTVWLFAKQGRLTPHKLSERVTVFRKSEIDKEFFGGLQ